MLFVFFNDHKTSMMQAEYIISCFSFRYSIQFPREIIFISTRAFEILEGTVKDAI